MRNQSQSDRFTTHNKGKGWLIRTVFRGGSVFDALDDSSAAEGMAGLEGPLRGVDQAEVDDHDAEMHELVLKPFQVTLEPLLQPWALRR